MYEIPYKNKFALGILFRLPEFGKVKTRLASQTGDDIALQAYQAMLYETIRNVQKLKGIDIYGFYDGKIEGELEFAETICCIPQKGRNLGQRMSNALNHLFKLGYKKTTLIGSDSPDLPLQYIQKAFYKLTTYELVLGPAKDGGYYLIGMSKPLHEIFKGIYFGSKDVLKKTLMKANQADIRVFLLPEWYDIDDLSSLKLWLKNQDCGLNIFYSSK